MTPVAARSRAPRGPAHRTRLVRRSRTTRRAGQTGVNRAVKRHGSAQPVELRKQTLLSGGRKQHIRTLESIALGPARQRFVADNLTAPTIDNRLVQAAQTDVLTEATIAACYRADVKIVLDGGSVFVLPRREARA